LPIATGPSAKHIAPRPVAKLVEERWYHGESGASVQDTTEALMPEFKNQPEFKKQSLHASASEAVTNNIRVEVESQYAPEHSQPFQNHWFFYYTVRITNEGEEKVQLLSRHWIITEDSGHTEEVKGPGVVGEQPVLGPGETFQYTSGCSLKTATGVMHGTYEMVTGDGDHFDVEIAPFALHEPYTVH
jgi:ApaG protein